MDRIADIKHGDCVLVHDFRAGGRECLLDERGVGHVLAVHKGVAKVRWDQDYVSNVSTASLVKVYTVLQAENHRHTRNGIQVILQRDALVSIISGERWSLKTGDYIGFRMCEDWIDFYDPKTDAEVRAAHERVKEL
jgi:hypothetical protein